MANLGPTEQVKTYLCLPLKKYTFLTTIFLFSVDPDSDHLAKPDYNVILSANSYGKRVLGVKHPDEKISKGSFLAYDYGATYVFKKAVVEKSVSIICGVYIPFQKDPL